MCAYPITHLRFVRVRLVCLLFNNAFGMNDQVASRWPWERTTCLCQYIRHDMTPGSHSEIPNLPVVAGQTKILFLPLSKIFCQGFLYYVMSVRFAFSSETL